MTFGNVGRDRNAGREKVVCEDEPVWMLDCFDNIEAHIDEIHTHLPYGQISVGFDLRHAPMNATCMPARKVKDF
jgi:hypothetical protein